MKAKLHQEATNAAGGITQAGGPPSLENPLTEYRCTTAQAADGPAPTLVVDLTGMPEELSHDALRAVLLRIRVWAQVAFPGTGAKTVAVLPSEPDCVRLLFVQGLGDDVDPAVEVCLNSGSAAVAVARHVWGLVPEGPLRVEMGSAVFSFREVA